MIKQALLWWERFYHDKKRLYYNDKDYIMLKKTLLLWTKTYFDEKLQEINDDKQKITEFIDRKPIEYEEKDEIYSVEIDEALSEQIWNDMNDYIILRSIDDKSEGIVDIIYFTFIHT